MDSGNAVASGHPTDARQLVAGLVYLVAYVALDRVSFFESYA
jgi:hypothetical protein